MEKLTSGHIEYVYFDDYKIDPSKFEIIYHSEEGCIEFDSSDCCYGGETVCINLKACTRIKFIWRDNSDPEN